MARNVVICSDGTGNTFDRNPTNVTALLRLLTLDPRQQIAVYDQGIGTSADRAGAVRGLTLDAGQEKALKVLPAPAESGVRGWLDKIWGQATGYGLKENVRQLYQAVAEHCRPEDRLFLFGFSRGAFTVRALAGLIHRCGLPDIISTNALGSRDLGSNDREFAARFERAWELFQPINPTPGQEVQIAAFKASQRSQLVTFLGVWDTVKSYGGLDPVILPHLRHNPAVRTVRHALALDERRAWFKPTTWGRLDSDQDAAMTRIPAQDLAQILDQDILEVWFSGCHSDIGGGGPQHATTARIALRWMLGEAASIGGLLLNTTGAALMAQPDPTGPPEIHPSWTRRWRALEQIRRNEIDNSGIWPVKEPHRGSDGVRDPFRSRRDGQVFVHTTVGARHSVPGPVHFCPTILPGDAHGAKDAADR